MASDGSLVQETSDAEDRITMGVLRAVEADASISQRSMAAGLNIALGLTNAYLKRCIRKGLIKVQKVPANRYAYYLTPRGFSEKSRLTASYLARSFRFYRRARNQVDALLEQAADENCRRVVLAGSGELAEVALLCALQYEIEIVGVIDPEAQSNRFRHVPMVREISALTGADAVLITELKSPETMVARMRPHFPPARILCPPLLGVSPDPVRPAHGDAAP